MKAGRDHTGIRVEDYKRPTFDITFEKQQGSYKLGDEVQVKGKVQSYSGVLLQDLPVKYTVKRSAYSLWRFAESVQIASGEVMANENGEFTIPVRLQEIFLHRGLHSMGFADEEERRAYQKFVERRG